MLHGIKVVLAKETGLTRIALGTNNQIKNTLEKQNTRTYPYAWLEPSDGQARKDVANKTSVQRFGYGYGLSGATRNTTKRAFVWPITLGMQLKYQDNDPMRVMRLMETFLILSSINMLSFDMRFGSDFVLNTQIVIPDNISIPLGDTDNTSEPGASELALSLVISTWAGFTKDVASVNSSKPTLGYTIKGDGETENFVPGYFPRIPTSELPSIPVGQPVFSPDLSTPDVYTESSEFINL